MATQSEFENRRRERRRRERLRKKRIRAVIILVVLIDYVFAFGVLGLSGVFYSAFGKKYYSAIISAFVVTSLRYACHIVSGILIWGVYAGEGQSVLMYSLVYNGTYMVPEIIISTVVAAIVFKSNNLKKVLSAG